MGVGRALSPACVALVAGLAPGLQLATAAAAGNPAFIVYVTERHGQGVARLSHDAAGNVVVDNGFLTGLPPQGPDYVLFDQYGDALVSNTDQGSIVRIDPTRARPPQQVNDRLIPDVGDLALDPAQDRVWAVAEGHDGVFVVTLSGDAAGSTAQLDPADLHRLTGLAFGGSAGRLFVSSLDGAVDELSPADGHLVRTLVTGGSLRGLTYEPAGGHLFASGCVDAGNQHGLCEISIGTDSAPELVLTKVHTAIDGDGLNPDADGDILVAGGDCCLWHLNPGSEGVAELATTIRSADDVSPAIGLGSPPDNPPPFPAPQRGFWLAGADGGVFPFAAPGPGSLGGGHLNRPIVAVVRGHLGRGYWLIAADGGVFPFGPGVAGYGSTGNLRLNSPIVAAASTPDGRGYWLAAADGGVFPFGDAAGYGSAAGRHLNRPIVAMAASPLGGYWLVAADGGVFPFGPGAAGYGTLGAGPLNQPIVAVSGTADGQGYWLVARDGGVFPFGDARGYGSAAGRPLAAPVVGVAPTSDGAGYWLAAADGGVFPFGDAPGFGSAAGTPLARPVVAIAGA